ncbi:transmembrane protein 174 [Megalops cyprinoides]|uniref:transmembrane protein 174 n=1 Tax=Megalops cyprinoides TaxID=118141 RepID=UPI001863BE5E|nr:transmembrane protein 174 [Megalops cyprinoides]
MEQRRGTTCSAVNTCDRNNNTEDFSLNVFSVTPYPPTRPDIEVSDGDKAGATLLFSGVFLGLVGITFTVMGWINYDISKSFEWTQLLGPILLSVGVTFVLIGVCKFKMLTCKLCKHCDDRPQEAEPPQSAQSFVFTGINQPITFHGATVVQYIPPPYAHDGGAANNVSSRGILPGVSRTTCPPQYCTIYPLDNPSFAGDDHCTPSLQVDSSNSRNHENEERPDGKASTDETLDSSAPPAYGDIFPVPLPAGST